MADNDTARVLLKRLDKLKTLRSTWETHWQEIAEYIVPRKADITVRRSSGDKRTENIFDGTAIHAAEMLSASLHGMLTNPSTQWFGLDYLDIALNVDDEAKEYLESVTEVMQREFQRSNFAEQVHELYHDLITFGTGVMFIDRAPENQRGIRFATRHISECYLSEDDYGRVDTVFREYKLPLRAMARKFGKDAIGEKMRRKLEKDPYEEIKLVHIVMPRDERDVNKVDANNKPWASIHIEPEQKLIIREGGYDEFPYCCPRFLKASFEQGYGRSPSYTALPDTKMINKMSEVTIKAAQKQIDPPLMVPDDGFILPVRTRPGGLNFYRSGTRDRIEPLNIGANNPLGLQIEEQRRSAIRSAFYVDQLVMAQGPQMTATEVMARQEQAMRLLGPVLGRLQAELLQPMIERVFRVLSRQNIFADPPENVAETGLQIEYVSPLAKAQRQSDVQSIVRLFELLSPLAGIDPTVFDHLDLDGLVRYMLKTLSIPAQVTKGEAEIMQSRMQRAEQQQQQQQLDQATQTAEALGSVAPAVKVLQQGAAA
tara:strand:+ start:3043 stop:4665 length:1623 start_codon:yes stop_codon:yes gene_type:complete